ncbi:uncharacterized protein [Dermacentor albipictus]|uniref:uncharacterized protein isoform X2 n=1 Tax=Dermacentor albipictus TaxID=60249 RepID=UPI0038FBE91D
MSSSYTLIDGAQRGAREPPSSEDERSSSDECRFGVSSFSITHEPRPGVDDAPSWWKPVQLCASAVTRLQRLGSCHAPEGSPVLLVQDDSEPTGTSDEHLFSVPSSAAGSRARGSSLAAAESCSRRRAGEASTACPALGLSAGVAAAGALLPHAPRSTATRSAVSSAPTMAAQTPGGVAPLPPRYRFRDLILGDFAYGDDGTRQSQFPDTVIAG